jgi:phosphohistidine phosphatase
MDERTLTERTLLILRHAKAVRESSGGDKARPLNDRGLANASAAGRWLLAEGLIPDRVLCSTATRTRQTWQQVAASLGEAGGRVQVSFDERVYDAGAGSLLGLIRECPDSVQTLLVVGHNPAVQELAAGLTGQPALAFPTCALAVTAVRGSWRDAGPAVARARDVWRPPHHG